MNEDGWIGAMRTSPPHWRMSARTLRGVILRRACFMNCAAVVSYHPACWLIRRRIAETRELVCDEMAAAAVGDRPEYAASLLRLATAMAAPLPKEPKRSASLTPKYWRNG